jgi:hypothetical protein
MRFAHPEYASEGRTASQASYFFSAFPELLFVFSSRQTPNAHRFRVIMDVAAIVVAPLDDRRCQPMHGDA